MATNFAYIKGPSDFEFGDDVDLFWERFMAFLTSAKCEKGSHFSLLRSHLDDRSLRRVHAIEFKDEHKTDNEVDISKPSVVELIKAALTQSPDIPERISLKFKVQGPDESVIEFGDAIRLLGQKVYGSATDTNGTVIESFSAGLLDANLAAKMLQKSFTNLTEAIDYAVARKEATNIKNVLVHQRGLNGTKNVRDLSVLPAETTPIEGQITQDPCSNNDSDFHAPIQQTYRRRDNIKVCYNCSRRGHVSAECRFPRSREQGFSHRNGPIICFKCHKPGHVQRFCRVSQPTPGRGYTHGNVVNDRYVRHTPSRGQTTYGSNFRAPPGTLSPLGPRRGKSSVWRPQ